MISQWLSNITRIAIRRPGRVIAAACAVSLLGLPALFVPWDMSFAPLMDRSEPEVDRYFEASQRYGLGSWLLLLVEGPEDRIDEAVQELELDLDDLDMVRAVDIAPPREWLMAQTPWLVDDQTFELWIAYATDPINRERLSRLQTSLSEFAERRLQPFHPGKRLVLITLENESFELGPDSQAFPLIRSASREALAPFGAEGSFAGMPAVLAQEHETTLARMSWLVALSLLLVLGIFRRIDRRLLVLCSVAVPILASAAVTLGVIAMLVGHITLMETIFGVVVLGLGIDFAIHLVLRMREERRRGQDFETALLLAMTGTGRSIVAAAVTSGGAFLILALAPDPVFHRLGLAGGLGLLLCLGFLLCSLPASWTLIERHRPAPDFAAVPLAGLQRLPRAAARAPGITVCVSLVLLAGSLEGIRRLQFETNLERIFSRGIAATETGKRIHNLYGLDTGFWLVAEPEPKRARQVAEAFEIEPQFAFVQSTAFLLPAEPSIRSNALDELAPTLAQYLRRQERATLGRTDAAALQMREDRLPLEALLRAVALGPPTLAKLPSTLKRRLVGPDGEWLTYAFAAEPTLDARAAGHQRSIARAIAPQAVSVNSLYEVLLTGERDWMTPLLMAVIIFVLGFLYLDLRRTGAVALVMLPLLVGGTLTLGVLGFVGFRFNLVTLVGIPLLVGIGVDNGIHIVHRMLEQPTRSVSEATAAVTPGIAMMTLTTCVSLSTLLLADHPGIESFAILITVGLLLCFFSSVMLLPATFQLAGRLRARGE